MGGTPRAHASEVVDEAEPLGALVIRVWRRSDGREPVLVARLMGQHDTQEATTTYAAGVANILARTREWLRGYEAETDRS
jgi:hypothetical protein